MKHITVLLFWLFSASICAQQTIEALEHIYQVKKGDTAYRIALNHGITVEELVGANPEIADGKVKKGMFLTIPAPKAKQEPAFQAAAAMQPASIRTAYDHVRVAVLLPLRRTARGLPSSWSSTRDS